MVINKANVNIEPILNEYRGILVIDEIISPYLVANSKMLCRRCNRQKSNHNGINFRKKNRDGREKSQTYEKK